MRQYQQLRFDFAEHFVSVLKNYFDMQGTETSFHPIYSGNFSQ